mmetsp:Transcript_35009/g.111375  ORF Transcript_35009/g.111375 Transcript_35009/m.111375 type:complete len:150 (+) Transcript_35009:704-1153(+)
MPCHPSRCWRRRGPAFFPVRRDLQLYALSKLCNIMFAKELARRWGPQVLAVSLHPGSSMLTNGGESAWLPRLWLRLVSPWTKTIAQGASTVVFAAVARGIAGGDYLNDCSVSSDLHPDAQDGRKSRELWDFTERLLANLTDHRQTRVAR